MAIGCADALSKMGSGAVTSRLQAGYADTDLDAAWIHWNSAEYPEAIEDLLKACDHLRMSCGYADYAYSPYHAEGACVWYLKNCIEAPEITWQDICEAWAKDDFAGRVATIGFIDRMRQLLWNEPYYIAWAARPEQQEL